MVHHTLHRLRPSQLAPSTHSITHFFCVKARFANRGALHLDVSPEPHLHPVRQLFARGFSHLHLRRVTRGAARGPAMCGASQIYLTFRFHRFAIWRCELVRAWFGFKRFPSHHHAPASWSRSLPSQSIEPDRAPLPGGSSASCGRRCSPCPQTAGSAGVWYPSPPAPNDGDPVTRSWEQSKPGRMPPAQRDLSKSLVPKGSRPKPRK